MSVDVAIRTLKEKAQQANELQRLRDRVEELEQLLGLVSEDDVDRFACLRLTPTERHLVNVLYEWKIVRREKLYQLLFGMRLECDQPDIKILDVHLCKLRKRLVVFDVHIRNQWNGGWYFTVEDKEKLRVLSEQGKPCMKAPCSLPDQPKAADHPQGRA